MPPRIVQYMLLDVLFNTGAYRNEYSIYEHPYVYRKMWAHMNATPAVNMYDVDIIHY